MIVKKLLFSFGVDYSEPTHQLNYVLEFNFIITTTKE